MIFQQCPICGRYMIPNMSETSGWYQCVCGYDSRSYVYVYTNHSSDFADGEERRMTENEKQMIREYLATQEITTGIASTPTYTLISELERRGYNVTKKKGEKKNE